MKKLLLFSLLLSLNYLFAGDVGEKGVEDIAVETIESVVEAGDLIKITTIDGSVEVSSAVANKFGLLRDSIDVYGKEIEIAGVKVETLAALFEIVRHESTDDDDSDYSDASDYIVNLLSGEQALDVLWAANYLLIDDWYLIAGVWYELKEKITSDLIIKANRNSARISLDTFGVVKQFDKKVKQVVPGPLGDRYFVIFQDGTAQLFDKDNVAIGDLIASVSRISWSPKGDYCAVGSALYSKDGVLAQEGNVSDGNTTYWNPAGDRYVRGVNLYSRDGVVLRENASNGRRIDWSPLGDRYVSNNTLYSKDGIVIKGGIKEGDIEAYFIYWNPKGTHFFKIYNASIGIGQLYSNKGVAIGDEVEFNSMNRVNYFEWSSSGDVYSLVDFNEPGSGLGSFYNLEGKVFKTVPHVIPFDFDTKKVRFIGFDSDIYYDKEGNTIVDEGELADFYRQHYISGIARYAKYQLDSLRQEDFTGDAWFVAGIPNFVAGDKLYSYMGDLSLGKQLLIHYLQNITEPVFLSSQDSLAISKIFKSLPIQVQEFLSDKKAAMMLQEGQALVRDVLADLREDRSRDAVRTLAVGKGLYGKPKTLGAALLGRTIKGLSRE